VISAAPPTRAQHHRRIGGVTLIETLAALALVAAVGTVVTRAWLLTMDVAARSRAQTVAATLAETRLAEILSEEDFDSSEDEDAFEEPWEAYRWKSSIAEWSEDSRLRQVDVTITWTRRDMEYQTTLSTLVDAEQE
jgi:type II secretion system protein I